MSTQLTVIYKGRPYLLLWSGETKYGNRARLSYLNGKKEFWVDSSALSTQPQKEAPASAATVPVSVAATLKF